MTQLKSPTMITYRETPYHLNITCSSVLLLNSDITRHKQGLGLALLHVAMPSIMGLRMCFVNGVSE